MENFRTKIRIKKGEEVVFKKPENDTGTRYTEVSGQAKLNEINREFNLATSKPTPNNTEKPKIPPTKEEIEKVVKKINEKIDFTKNPTEAETEEIVEKINQELGL